MLNNTLIVFEGIDGAGKATQVSLLARHLRAHGHTVATFSFPRYRTVLGTLIRDYLHGKHGDVAKADPFLLALPYALDRALAAPQIRAALGRGMVLADRYTQSSLAFGAARLAGSAAQRRYVRFVEDLEYRELGVPRASLVVHLAIPTSFAQRFLRKERGAKDHNERDVAYQARVARMYARLSKAREWRTVPCTDKNGARSPRAIHQDIVRIVERLGAGPVRNGKVSNGVN